MASPAVWKEGRVVARMLQLGDDAQIVQTLQNFGESAGSWEVTSTIVREEDPGDARSGRAEGLRAAKKLADQHVDDLRKTWAAEGGAEW